MPISNKEEVKFWLQLMGDHAIMIRGALLPNSDKEILEADQYIEIFDELLKRAGKTDTEELPNLYKAILPVVQDFRRFVLTILKKQLTDGIRVNIQLSFSRFFGQV